MSDAGIYQVHVEPREAYADQKNPELLDGAVNQIIAPMVFSAEKQVLEKRLVEPHIWKKGLSDLSAVATSVEGTFFYSWFKGVGRRS